MTPHISPRPAAGGEPARNPPPSLRDLPRVPGFTIVAPPGTPRPEPDWLNLARQAEDYKSCAPSPSSVGRPTRRQTSRRGGLLSPRYTVRTTSNTCSSTLPPALCVSRYAFSSFFSSWKNRQSVLLERESVAGSSTAIASYVPSAPACIHAISPVMTLFTTCE